MLGHRIFAMKNEEENIEWLSVTAFAKRIEVHHSTVLERINKGRLPYMMNEKGKKRLNFSLCHKMWYEDRNENMVRPKAKCINNRYKPENKIIPPEESNFCVESDGFESYGGEKVKGLRSIAESRAIKEHYSAQMILDEYLVKQGKLIHEDELYENLAIVANTFKQMIRNLPQEFIREIEDVVDPEDYSLIENRLRVFSSEMWNNGLSKMVEEAKKKVVSSPN
jgi:hypothetical protein